MNSSSFIDKEMDPNSPMNSNPFIYNEIDESNGSDEPSDSLELTSGLIFTDWKDFKSWIHRFALKEGFGYRIRTSEKVEGVLRRVTYECTKSGAHISQTSSDPTKRRDAQSSRILCQWKLNASFPKTSAVVKSIRLIKNIITHLHQ